MKEKSRTKKPKKFDPLDSPQWISESTFARNIATPTSQAAFHSDSAESSCTVSDYKGSLPLGEIKVDIKDVKDPEDVDPNDKKSLGTTGAFPQNPGIKVETFCDSKNGVWRLAVTKRTIGIAVRIKKSRETLTEQGLASTKDCAVLKEMLADVIGLKKAGISIPEGTKWIPTGFLLTHENVHVAILKETWIKRYGELVADLDAISVACSGHNRRQASEAMAKALDTASEKFIKNLKKDIAKNGDHQPRDRFIKAITDFLEPWERKIGARMKALGCK